MISAAACPVIPANFQAIVSEGVYQVDRADAIEYIMNWVRENIEGYYLRDYESPFDCHLIEAETFKEIYVILPPDTNNSIFQKVEKK